MTWEFGLGGTQWFEWTRVLTAYSNNDSAFATA